jgi:predicted metalloprotease
MAFWDKISSRGHVEDRRGAGPLLIGGGGLGLGGIVLWLLISYLSGGELSPDVLNDLQGMQINPQQINTQAFQGADDYEVFVSTVLGSNNDMWEQIFNRNNRTYVEPKLVLFRGATQGACGLSSAAVGPHYCPNDQTIYLDETFFDELQRRFRAKGGDVAQAYVISHEVGHHAQNLLGLLDQTSSNEGSIRVELQADCFAGLWAYSVKNLGVFEPNEITEALDAAAAVGDDRIQKTTQGQVTPETWTHGSSEDRVRWFTEGYNTGEIAKCNIS